MKYLITLLVLCNLCAFSQNPIAITAQKNAYQQPGLAYVGEQIITPYSTINNYENLEYSILEYYDYSGNLVDSIAIVDSNFLSLRVRAVHRTDNGLLMAGTKGNCFDGLELFISKLEDSTLIHTQIVSIALSKKAITLLGFFPLNDSLSVIYTDSEVYIANTKQPSINVLFSNTGTIKFSALQGNNVLFSTSQNLLAWTINSSVIDTIRDGFHSCVTVDEAQNAYVVNNFALVKLDKNLKAIDSLHLLTSGLYIGGPERMAYSKGKNYLLDDDRILEVDTLLQTQGLPYTTAYQRQSSVHNTFGIHNNNAVVYGFKDFQIFAYWPKTSLLNILPLDSSHANILSAELYGSTIDTLYIDTLTNGELIPHFKLSYTLELLANSLDLNNFVLHVYHSNGYCTDPQITLNVTGLNVAAGNTIHLQTPWLHLDGFKTIDSTDLQNFQLKLKATAFNRSDFESSNNLHDITQIYSIGIPEYNTIRIYPNPFNDYLEINLLKPVEATLLDMQSKVIKTQHLRSGKTIWNTSGLDHGLYILVLKSDHEVRTIKLIH